MAGPLKAEEVAKFAAEGVAIALKARDPNYRGPIHIICGLPVDNQIFRVEITADQQGALRAGSVQEHQSGR
jgi:hypothetical protein